MKRLRLRTLSLVVVAGLVLAACGPTPTPQIVKETVVVEKEVEVTKVVEKEVEVTTVVEKEVEVTTVVEKVVTPTPSGPKRGGTLTIARANEPHSLDVRVDPGLEGNIVLFQVCDALYDFTIDGQVVPGLATSHEISDDQLTWTFNLRKDVKFSNGDPFTAQDVVDGWIRQTHPDSPSSFKARYLAYIEPPPWEGGVEAVDDYTVRFHLVKPWPQFLYHLSRTIQGRITNKRAVEEGGEGYGFATFTVGTGPFMVKEWVKDDHVTLVPNPYSWQMGEDGQPLPYLDELVFKVVPEGTTRLLQLKSGQLDVDMDPDPKDATALLDDPNFTVLHGGGHITALMYLNTRVPPFDDVRLRRAFSYVIDRQQIVDALYYGFAEPTSDFFPSRAQSVGWLHDPDYPIEYYPDKAKVLLEEAGYGPGNPFEFTLMSLNTSPYIDVATMIQAQAAQVGMKVEVLPLSYTAVYDYVRGLQGKDPNEFKAALVRTGAKDSSIEWGTRYFWSKASLNFSGYNQEGGYQNPEVEKLVEEVMALSDYIPEEQEKMKELYGKLTPIVRSDVPFIDIVRVENLDVLQNYVKGRGMLGVEHGRWIWAWLDK